MKLLQFTLCLFLLVGCNNTDSIKDTTWFFSSQEGTSTLVFSDSTYTCVVKHDGVEEDSQGTYKYVRPNIELRMNGNSINASIDGNKMTTKDEYPITFEKQ